MNFQSQVTKILTVAVRAITPLGPSYETVYQEKIELNKINNCQSNEKKGEAVWNETLMKLPGFDGHWSVFRFR